MSQSASRRKVSHFADMLCHRSVVESFDRELTTRGLNGTTAGGAAQSRCKLRGMTLIRVTETHGDQRKADRQ